LSLNHYKALSGVPILFSSVSSLDAVFSKLKTFLPSEGGLSPTEVKQLDKIHSWLRKREEAKATSGTEPTVGELGATWKPLLGADQIVQYQVFIIYAFVEPTGLILIFITRLSRQVDHAVAI